MESVSESEFQEILKDKIFQYLYCCKPNKNEVAEWLCGKYDIQNRQRNSETTVEESEDKR